MALLAKVNSILEKQGYKGDTFGACDTACIKMVFTLPTEVVALHVQACIV